MASLITNYLYNPTLAYVLIGVICSTSSTAIIGCFCFLQKKTLAGDAIAHALLPGLCLGFLYTGTQAPFYLIIGACTTGALALFLIDYLPTHSKIKQDTATALVLSSFFGIGLLLLTHIQQSGNVHQAGLQSFLFGHAATLVSQDLLVFTMLSIILIITTILFFKEFKLIIFDARFAHTIGWPVRSLKLLLHAMIILAIVAGIRSIGVILIASILISPAAAARFWTDRLPTMLILATTFAILASIIGTLLSYKISRLPTGPCIVLTITAIALFSFSFSPKKGFIARKYRAYQYHQKVLTENIIKMLYKLGQKDGQHNAYRKEITLLEKRPMNHKNLVRTLKKLQKQGLVAQKKPALWALTSAGKTKGAHMLHLHILWEAYLARHLKIQPDHVHDDAEAIEHLITPELEADLTRLLNDLDT